MQQGAESKLISSFPPLSKKRRGMRRDRRSKNSGSNGASPFKAMTKRKWEGRREGFRVNTTREEAQGPGRPTSRGRFSESWKRLSSRQGSTKRSGLAAQQAAVRTGMASVCGLTGGWHGRELESYPVLQEAPGI
ncbi:hypothetical protein HF521_014859 [Silurus meridionalis]|uniref:Uncharacterized protein n=1 Tax=Silurus meridionalis TaxID=175797 RepID=A0A8T0A6X8_SILME|nr:hypothetical protein HF521_014859 [Silurus meridionalis]